MAQAGYSDIADFEDHKREPGEMGAALLDEVLAEPSLKFIVRHLALTPHELLAELRTLNLGGYAVTHSGAPFLEVLAEGVSKAWGLAKLCGKLGTTQGEVLAFGDAPNDAELLAWAGRGVAMANAEEEALAAVIEKMLTPTV